MVKKGIAGAVLVALVLVVVLVCVSAFMRRGSGHKAAPAPSQLSGIEAAHAFGAYASVKFAAAANGVTIARISCANVNAAGKAVPDRSSTTYVCAILLRKGTASECDGVVFTLLPGSQPAGVKGKKIAASYCA